MTEYLLTICIFFVIIYALVKGCSININISVKQEFSQEDRKLLEDLFNENGDPKESNETVAVDEVLRSINDFMLGNEEDING